MAQTSGTAQSGPRLLRPDEIIRHLPGRWEYRPEDGWGSGSLERGIRCDGSAERIWFDHDAKGLIFHSKSEAAGSELNTSRVMLEGVLFFQKPLIRIQYDDEDRKDDTGKLVAWEVWMVDADTFYWHRVDWPPDGTTAPVRRCKDKLTY